MGRREIKRGKKEKRVKKFPERKQGRRVAKVGSEETGGKTRGDWKLKLMTLRAPMTETGPFSFFYSFF